METVGADTTARPTIRNAALVEFAEKGVGNATVRGVAARAGVSPALVQHHFRTKERLREACDTYVLDYLRTRTASGIDDGRIGDPTYLRDVYDSAAVPMRYLARALVDGSARAAELFDEIVRLTEDHLAHRPGGSDPHTLAVVYTAMKLGVTVLHEHVSRGLGRDVFDPRTAPDVGRATLEVTAPELLPDGLADTVRAGLDHVHDHVHDHDHDHDEEDHR